MPDSGWYPDPSSTDSERYWDGNAWTTSTRPIQQQGTPPAPTYQPSYEQPAAPPAGSEQPGYAQPNYGQPNYGQPAYGQPAGDQPAYGQPASEQPNYGQPAYGGTTPSQFGGYQQPGYQGAPAYQPAGQYLPYGSTAPTGGVGAEWGRRAGAYLIDWGIGVAILVVGFILGAIIGGVGGDAGGVIALLTFIVTYGGVIGFSIWNQWIRQGKTGQTIGKSKVGLKLVNDETGQPPGIGGAIVRYLVASVLSSVTCGIFGVVDVLSPLWDPRNQRLTDKWLKLMVYDVPKS
ncbi:MAG: RDD family protein [Acidimicrobiales bacterium]